ncbi:calcium-activated chloride channel regulator 1-like isoform X1 [Branchiostoma floridae]|uniref:Calcium-activated chloride channel regulator 1-like isoform X1 n=1 Tax=Branchiostoma floridae TaxID=7739 RepID=A0A9J7LVU2_BRAFL|nr:calcium-activated chloride channel regulator 1-like isoform X1 [Branchiostoma floridae]
MPTAAKKSSLLGLFVCCLFLCCFRVSGAARLQNNAYQDVVVAIAESVPEDGALLTSLRVKFTEASYQLFAATGGRAYFGTVKILVPRTWDYYGSYQFSHGERFGRAEIRVGPAVDGLASFTRATARALNTCGRTGDFMYLATNMMTGDNIVQEWGRYRWGVDGDWALGSWDGSAPTTETGQGSDTPTPLPNSGTTAGSANATGITEAETEVYPEPEPTHAVPVTAGDSACSGQAAWDTILATEDFTNGQNPPQNMNIPDPTFEFLYQTELRKEVLVLDTSGSMGKKLLFNLRQSLTSHVYNLPIGSSLGIVTFNSEATINAPMTVIGNETTRDALVGALPMTTGGKTSIGSGLQEALGLLGNDLGRIILISDGQEDELPHIADVLPALRVAGHTVHTVAIGADGDPMLEQLSRDTGGKSFYHTRWSTNFPGILRTIEAEDTTRVPLKTAFLPFVSPDQPGHECVYVDPGTGNDTLLEFIFSCHMQPEDAVFLYSDSEASVGWRMEEGLVTSLGDVKTVRITMPGHVTETHFCFDVEPDMSSYPDPPCGWGTKVSVTSGRSDLSVPTISVHGAFSLTSADLASGNSVVLYALVEKDYACVIGADVTAVVTRPHGKDAEVMLKDDGQGVDAVENDGIYSAEFERFLGNGRYNVMVKVLGSRAMTQVDTSCVAGVSGGSDISVSDSQSVSDFDRVVAVGSFQVSGYDGPLEEEEPETSSEPEPEPVAVIAMGAGVGTAAVVALLIILVLVVLKKKGKRAQSTAPSPTQIPIDDSFSVEDEEEMGISNGTAEKHGIAEEQVEEEAGPPVEEVVHKRTPTPTPPPVAMAPVAMPTVEEPEVVDPAVLEEQRRQEEERKRKEAERKRQEMEKAKRIQMEDQLLKDLRRALRSGDRKEVGVAEEQYKASGMYDDANISPEIAKLREIWNITDGLKVAVGGRRIKEVEPAVEIARAACENMTSSGRITLPSDITNKVEKEKVKQEVADRKQKALEELQAQAEEGEKVLKTLKHLEKLRHEVLEMKQSTVAEIRNYGHPPPQVHTVMISTYLMLGTPEKETQNWQAVQALMGKTGKQGIKRMVAECDPDMIPRDKAERAAKLLSEFDLAQVRDVSAGAATFYVWAEGMVEEVKSRPMTEE